MRGNRHQPKAPTPYPRTARVNEVLREIVAEELERVADVDDRLKMATVTSVATSPDLRQATVYMSSLSDETAAALEERRIAIQRAISRQVRLKRTPLLQFAADPAVAEGFKVEEILRRIRDDEAADDGGVDGGEERREDHVGP